MGAAAFFNRVFYFWKLFLLRSVSSSDTERALVTVSFKDAGAALHAQGRAAALKLRLPGKKENIDYFASYSSLLVCGIFCWTLPFSRAMAVLPPLARFLPALPGDSCRAIGLCLAVKWVLPDSGVWGRGPQQSSSPELQLADPLPYGGHNKTVTKDLVCISVFLQKRRFCGGRKN